MANKKGGNTVSIVTDLVEPLVLQQGLILWDVRFEKEGSMWLLRIILEKEGGITVDDCESISRPLDKLLDEVDPIEQSYCLEVASAGLERELTKQWHFDQCIGKEVLVKLIRPQDGERDFVGELKSFCDNTVNIENDNKAMAFNINDVAYVRLTINF